jgi:hypothetical protein
MNAVVFGATRTLRKYEIITETATGRIKSVTTDDYEQALRMFEKYKQFAKKHNITLTISLYGQGFLYESETVNPTKIISIN